MKFYKIILKTLILFSLLSISIFSQPEFETAQTKITSIWGGIAANGDRATFDFRAGFFPNDFNFVQHRGQGTENYLGSGFRLACTEWLAPDDSLFPAAVFGPLQDDYLPFGRVIEPIKSYTRYKYAYHTVDELFSGSEDFAEYDPSKFNDGTYDQIVESTYKNVMGVEVKRRLLFWSQNYNDNYVIIEVELTNMGVDKNSTIVQDTLRNFYFSMNMGANNNYYPLGISPSFAGSERPNYGYIWQHYYGARPGDSLRVFYFYNADNPLSPGDDMGSPIISQRGRLANTNFTFYSILHASETPFTDPSKDIDDPLQPGVTYIGTETRMPNPSAGQDPYNSKAYWLVRGGFAARNPMPDAYPNTFHMINNDELGNPNFSAFEAGTISGVNSKNFSSFGPYNFPPGHKLRFVYVVGTAGIGFEKSKEVGQKWLAGTLEDPPNMPDPNTGWFPQNFAFPTDATEMDKRKDRWISMGIDSMMQTARRAKWNFEHNYQIPKAPPPPETFELRGSGLNDGVFITWKGTEAENQPNFAGYRLMRRFTNQDTASYIEIYNSGPEDRASEHTILDTTVLSEVHYYYYIQSKAYIDENDLTADPTSRGKTIYSSRLWIPNLNAVLPPKIASDDMSRIRIVPNPYNINDPKVRINLITSDFRFIQFFNLPPIVTIKIYTENGDLIKTIEHYEPINENGSNHWNMITDNQQVISSGVYIAVFQKTSGETSYQKFIVVR